MESLPYGGDGPTAKNGFFWRSWTLNHDKERSHHTHTPTHTNTHAYCDSHFGFVPLFCQNLCWNASLCITHAHAHTHTHTHAKENPASLWHTLTPSQHNLTQISHLLMTVTNASWLHWMAYIVSHTRLHSQHTHLHTHTRSTKMLITFIWLCVSVIKTDPTDTGGMNRATVCVFSSAFRCSHAFTNTHIHTHTVSLSLSLAHKHTSAQHLDLRGQ